MSMGENLDMTAHLQNTDISIHVRFSQSTVLLTHFLSWFQEGKIKNENRTICKEIWLSLIKLEKPAPTLKYCGDVPLRSDAYSPPNW